MQSPIAVYKECAIPMHYMPFKFINYDSLKTCSLKRTSDQVSIEMPPQTTKLPIVTGGGLFYKYFLNNIYLRWDCEHIINNIEYPLEVQLVHFARKYESYNNALNYKDGIGILSIFYEISKEPNKLFDTITKSISLLNPKFVTSSAELEEPISIDQFFPSPLGKFYRYQGSLTTAQYNEVATWTLFTNPSYLSKEQMESLKTIYICDGKPLENNYRELQCLNDRNVYLSKL